MKIAYIYGSKVPKKEADTLQVVNNVSSLKRQKLDIVLIIPKTLDNLFYSDKKLTNLICSYYSKDFDNILIKTIFTFPFYFYNIGRIFHDPVAVFYSKIKNYNYIYTRDLIAVFWARIFNINIIFETYRMFYSDHRFFFKIFFSFVKKNIKCIITHSEVSKNDLIKGGVNCNIIKCFHNGYDQNEFNYTLCKYEIRKVLNIDINSKIITYTGKINISKGILIILELAKLNKDKLFLLIGNKDNKTNNIIKIFIKKNHLMNIKLMPYMITKKLSKYLLASDILIIPPTNEAFKNKKTVLPIKTFQYLASAVPIIAPLQEDISEILTHMQNSILIKNNNIQDANYYLNLLLKNKELYNNISTQAKIDKNNYTWEIRAKNLISWFNKVLY